MRKRSQREIEEGMTMRKRSQREIGGKHRASTTVQRTLNTVTNKVSIVTATYKLWHTRSVDIQNVKQCVLGKHYTDTKYYDTDILKHISVHKTYYNL